MNKNFINNILYDKNLNASDKVLLIFFYNNKKIYKSNLNTDYSYKYIANNLGISKRTLIRSINNLETLNYLKKLKRRLNETKLFASNYYILAPINTNGDIDKNYIKNLDIGLYDNSEFIKREDKKNYIFII